MPACTVSQTNGQAKLTAEIFLRLVLLVHPAMPGTTMIGARGRQSANPSVRNIARLLRCIGEAADRRESLRVALAQTPAAHGVVQWQAGGSSDPLQLAQEVSDAFDRNQKSRNSSSSKSDDDESLPGKGNFVAASPTTSPQPTMTVNTAMTMEQTDTAMLVSDSETENAPTSVDVERELAVIDFWPNLLEALSLQVSCRTTRTWGQKKRYEVYRLAGPTQPFSSRTLMGLRRQIAQAFLKHYDAFSGDARYIRHGECRVFSQFRDQEDETMVWLQINIGRPFDCSDETNRSATDGLKQKKAGNEFVALLQPESNLVVLTASRAPSRSPFTPSILSALEEVLTCSASYGGKPQRVGDDLTGCEPLELLQQAKQLEAGHVVGWYAQEARRGAAVHPVEELRQASRGNLLQQEENEEVTERGEVTIVTHSGAGGKKRPLGEPGDCPVKKAMCWDWTANVADGTRFKCRVTLKGKDVWTGMQALVEAGLVEQTLPFHVTEGPSYGQQRIVRVVDGAIVREEVE